MDATTALLLPEGKPGVRVLSLNGSTLLSDNNNEIKATWQSFFGYSNLSAL